MLMVIEGKEVLEIQSCLPTGRRVLFLLLALFPLLAPYELIFRPGWQSYVNVIFLFAALISMGALAVSAFLVWAAIAGVNSRLKFDRANGTLTYSVGAPVIRWRSHRVSIEDIADLRVEEHEWTEGAPSYAFMVGMTDGRKFESGSSWSREEIEDVVQRVSAFIGRSTPIQEMASA